MMNKDPTKISSVLDFLSKQLDKMEEEEERITDYGEWENIQHKTKENLGIEKTEGKYTKEGEKKIMFYNIECKVLDGKSLLEYIDFQNVRLLRQREELIDLTVKIANLNRGGHAMEEVINHYKSGLPSGVGLRDMIAMIKERYPWSSSKTIIMIFVSLVTCLLGIGLFVFDLYTDVEFSLEMLKRNKTLGNDDESFNRTFKDFLSKNNLKLPTSKTWECLTDIEMEFDRRKNSKSDNILNYEDYVKTGWIAIWHCIQPFVATMLVSFSINYSRGWEEVKRSFRDIPHPAVCLRPIFCPTPYDKLNILLCGIPGLVFFALWYLVLGVGKLVPLPAFTHLYRFCLDVRCHIARSEPGFRTKIVSIEEEIKEHEFLGKL